MKILAIIDAELDQSSLGTRSRLADELGGVPVLRRTVERVLRVHQSEGTIVLCPQQQADRCRLLLDGLRVTVRGFEAPPLPWRALVRTARKWSLDGWRGGLGGTTYFDEFVNPRLIVELLKSNAADVVLCVPGSAALFDPGLAERMIEHHRAHQDETRMTFTQAPPGLAGLLLDAQVLADVAKKDIPVGWVFSYKPDSPQKDLIFQTCCFELPPEVRYAVGRVCGDTDRSWDRVAGIIRDRADTDASTVGRWLIEKERTTIEPLPREVEIELTTDDPYPGTLLRPRGSNVGRRGPILQEIVQGIAGDLCRFDDSLMVLGGFGDPLRHAQFNDILSAIRTPGRGAQGVYGLAVRTAGVDLSDDRIRTILDYDVDIVEMTLDAWSPGLYAGVQSPDGHDSANLDKVLSAMDRLNEASRERNSVKPIIVPSMVKAKENIHELDDFHDGWLRKKGTVCLAGYSHRAGQCDDHAVVNMAPWPRVPCRRLRSRCLVLADGRVTPCDEDFRGLQTVGDLHQDSLVQIWQSAGYQRIRNLHRDGQVGALPLCPRCDEWHRP